jgi:hypothetical protein
MRHPFDSWYLWALIWSLWYIDFISGRIFNFKHTLLFIKLSWSNTPPQKQKQFQAASPLPPSSSGVSVYSSPLSHSFCLCPTLSSMLTFTSAIPYFITACSWYLLFTKWWFKVRFLFSTTFNWSGRLSLCTTPFYSNLWPLDLGHIFNTKTVTSSPVERIFSQGGLFVRQHRACICECLLSHSCL